MGAAPPAPEPLIAELAIAVPPQVEHPLVVCTVARRDEAKPREAREQVEHAAGVRTSGFPTHDITESPSFEQAPGNARLDIVEQLGHNLEALAVDPYGLGPIDQVDIDLGSLALSCSSQVVNGARR